MDHCHKPLYSLSMHLFIQNRASSGTEAVPTGIFLLKAFPGSSTPL